MKNQDECITNILIVQEKRKEFIIKGEFLYKKKGPR